MERAPFGGRILTHLLFTRKASTRMQKRAPAAALVLALLLVTFTGTVRADDSARNAAGEGHPPRAARRGQYPQREDGALLARRCRLQRRHHSAAARSTGWGPASSSTSGATSSPTITW